jgi:hypothetical protein
MHRQMADMMKAMGGSWVLRGYGEFAVEDKASGQIAGPCRALVSRGLAGAGNRLDRPAGVSVARDMATRRPARAMRFAYEELGWTTAISCIAADNAASMKLAEKLGATRGRGGVQALWDDPLLPPSAAGGIRRTCREERH